MLAVVFLFAAGYLCWRLWSRRRQAAEDEPEAQPTVMPPESEAIVVADEHLELEPESAPADVSADGRRIIDADVELPTRLGNDSDDLRRRLKTLGDADIQALRRRVLGLELAAERAAQSRLAALLAAEQREAGRCAAAEANLLLYLGAEAESPEAAVLCRGLHDFLSRG